MKLDIAALALAIGIVLAVFTLVIGMVAVYTWIGLEYLNLIGAFTLGWSPTYFGACIMAAWMFAYGFIGGGLVALIYNYFA